MIKDLHCICCSSKIAEFDVSRGTLKAYNKARWVRDFKNKEDKLYCQKCGTQSLIQEEGDTITIKNPTKKFNKSILD
jgi:hypothetical protein